MGKLCHISSLTTGLPEGLGGSQPARGRCSVHSPSFLHQEAPGSGGQGRGQPLDWQEVGRSLVPGLLGPSCWHLACLGSPVTLPGCGLEGGIASCQFRPPARGQLYAASARPLADCTMLRGGQDPSPSLARSRLTPPSLESLLHSGALSGGLLHVQHCVASAFLAQRH